MKDKEQKAKVNITISVEPEIAAKLKQFAEDEDRSLNSYLTRVFKDHIAEKVTLDQEEAA